MPDDYTPDIRKRRRDEDFDEMGPEADEATVPKTVKAAGVIWIVFGGLILLNTVASLAMSTLAAGDARGPVSVCPALFGALFGAAFLVVGVQTVSGTAKDTLGNAIGSIVFALLNGGVGGLALVGAVPLVALDRTLGLILAVVGVVNILGGLGLLTAGVMALVGRGDYLTWKKAQLRRKRIED